MSEAVADEVRRFFAAYRPGLELPDGWFGRPFDNQHELTALTVAGDEIELELDGRARMLLRGPVESAVSEDGRSLTLSGFDAMSWQWGEYGSSGRQQRRGYDGGTVTFRTTARVLDVLAHAGEPDPEALPTPWVEDVQRSLAAEPAAWLAAARAEGGLTDREAWRLLGFCDLAASLVVRTRRHELVARAAFALALLEASRLDRRDEMVVADLLPRACEITGLDFAALARSGCAPAGDLGRQCLEWLLRRTPRTPPALYEEVGEGDEFRFRRTPSDFDEDALLAWLDRGRDRR